MNNFNINFIDNTIRNDLCKIWPWIKFLVTHKNNIFKYIYISIFLVDSIHISIGDALDQTQAIKERVIWSGKAEKI